MKGAYTILGLAFLFLIIAVMMAFSRTDREGSDTQLLTKHATSTQEVVGSNATSTMQEASTFTLSSEAFSNGEFIPSVHTCDGENVNPPLTISNVPDGTVTLALLVDDPDIPEEVKQKMNIEVFDHMVVYNISPEKTSIEQGDTFEGVGTFGVNGRSDKSYTGPCPPGEFEPRQHRYFFRAYAVGKELDLFDNASKAEVLRAMEGHILAEAELMGVYERPQAQ